MWPLLPEYFTVEQCYLWDSLPSDLRILGACSGNSGSYKLLESVSFLCVSDIRQSSVFVFKENLRSAAAQVETWLL